MRTNTTLIDGFDNIKILQQYLYMSEDHYIEIENILGVKLRIRMGEDLEYYCKNMNFPDAPEMLWSESMTTKTILAIVDQLKDSEATEYPKYFKSRWDEVKEIALMNVCQNAMKQRR